MNPVHDPGILFAAETGLFVTVHSIRIRFTVLSEKQAEPPHQGMITFMSSVDN